MRQQEAEQEAARRNAEDERRDRFVFYALDHSAGMGPDAWEVEMRLRTPDDGPTPAAVAVGAGAPAAAESPSEPPPEPLVEPDPLPATQPFDALEDVDAGPPSERPGAAVEPVEPLEPVAPAVRATEVDVELPHRRRGRRGLRLIHVWAAFVILVGLLFIGATLLLAVGLRDYTHFGPLPTMLGIVLGLVAVCVGVALARTG